MRPNFSKTWARALGGAGLDGIHFHDLRHTGNHLAALTGASTRELMGRMGHASMAAAIIYLHRTADRDRVIADALDVMLAAPGAAEPIAEGHAEGTWGRLRGPADEGPRSTDADDLGLREGSG